MQFKLGVQVYSVRDEAEKDLRATFWQIKHMGYEGVELAGLYSYSVEEVKAMAKEAGLTIISAHVPYLDMLADPKKVMKDYASLGCRYIAVPYLMPEYRPGTDKFPEVVENIAKLGQYAKDTGMQLLYHNHDFEFVKLGDKYALDVLYESVSPDLLKTELDTCWVKVGGPDPASYLRKYAGRSPVVHLKDYSGVKTENMYALIGIDQEADTKQKVFELRPFGFGVQNVPNILDAAKDAGAEWIIVEQDSPSMGLTPMESIALSARYLQLLNGIF